MATGTVLITGAGSGLGRALARRYARASWRVAAADIDRGRADAVVVELHELGVEAAAFVADVGDDASVAALREAVRARFGGIDHLVNNAGVASAGGVADTPLDTWRWTLEINLLGVVRGCRAFAADLAAQGRGHIVNIASFAALAGAPGLAPYAVAKAGVVTLSEALRAEFTVAGQPIGVSVVCPSFFRTRLLDTFRGPASARAFADRCMHAAAQSADDIAAVIFDGVMARRFLIVPTARERWLWRFKRLMPEFYFGALMRAVRAKAVAR